ncbi:MAG: NAD(P)H-dependent oxidoreductase [Hydrogenophaga sp.]|jgi:FMN-dependent NADH-azoreductase|uniref:FMN-dependent NADH-azoreductase n=1 Tax=Hydrogenophaga sp. TaxID=1904254 RepID=UPI00261830EC|nr:NAD(P)H-dependent oxidoreductase [Hydrogenophaga sp.]MCV0440919.1 NAD(P)H-dependent oxidoreductase [Hydrogenophaga sp.]
MTARKPITLVRIDASARSEGSFSRHLADATEMAWQEAHPEGVVVHRDLALEPIPHIHKLTIQGYYTPAAAMTPELRAATALSDSLIAEIKGAHTILISSPIYNFSLPSSLKAWIDQIVRIGHTFAYEDGEFSGLVVGPRAVLALSYGADGYQGPLARMDHLRPYLSALLSFVGIVDVQVLSVEATTGDSATAQAALDAATAQARTLFNAAPTTHAAQIRIAGELA